MEIFYTKLYMEWNALQAGIVSGICQTIIGYPLDSIKTWSQNYNKENPPKFNYINLYRGIQFPILQSPFTIATGFFVNESVYRHYNNIYISSFCSGSCISILLCPFDYYKINYQQNKKPSFLKCYNKLHIVAMREVPANMIYFSTYYHMRNYEFSPGISGAFAGICSWCLTYPMDTIKSRVQIQNHISLKDAFRQGSLYKGIGVTCLRAGIVNFIGFEVFEYTKHQLKKYNRSVCNI